METKTCVRCNNSLPMTMEYFPPRKNSADGFNNRCRECMRDMARLGTEKRAEQAQEKREYEEKRKADGRRVVRFGNDWKVNREGIRDTFKDYTGVASSFSKV